MYQFKQLFRGLNQNSTIVYYNAYESFYLYLNIIHP